MYRSPNSDVHNVNMKDVYARNYSHLLILGDFNFPEINWHEETFSKGANHVSSLFLEGIKDLFLYQHVNSATRYREHQRPSILDLILTNIENMISNLEYLPGLGKSDHIVLKIN